MIRTATGHVRLPRSLASAGRRSTAARRTFFSTAARRADGPNAPFSTVTRLKIDPEKPYTTEIVVREKHSLVGDEPESLGGKDLGPNPYDLLLAALGSCTCITVAMFAARKRIPLESVETRLKIYKIHRDDCETCTSTDEQSGSGVKLDRIEKHISFTGSGLTDEMRKRLFEISERCPVKLTLQRENDIVSTYEE